MLLGCLSIQAADDDLITKQITIKLDEAGTLPGRIASSKKYKITNLKIVGEINGTDLRMIREMAGNNYNGDSTKGNLSVLDLSEARIVEGGDDYFYRNGICYTSNDVIGSYAFYGCSRLTSINLPASITSIGHDAFTGCCGLTSLNLPAGITEIGYSAFFGCSGLTSLNLPAGITQIDNYVFLGCSGLTSINLPTSITQIGDLAFSDCSGLTSISLPASITKIGEQAFLGCSGLTSISLPASITKIGEDAFRNCSGLKSIYVYAEKVPGIGRYAFNGCDAKKCTVYVPKGTYDDYWLSEFGYFENIVEFDATGIDKTATSTDAKEVSRYSVNGQRLVGPTKGLNIVKYSDGSVKKVAVEIDGSQYLKSQYLRITNHRVTVRKKRISLSEHL